MARKPGPRASRKEEIAIIAFILIAARAFLFPAISPSTGHAVWLVVVLAVTGTLFVIPTAGEILIVQSFMKFGLGPAGAGAHMMTLPAVSLPSLLLVRQAVPLKVLLFVTGSQETWPRPGSEANFQASRWGQFLLGAAAYVSRGVAAVGVAWYLNTRPRSALGRRFLLHRGHSLSRHVGADLLDCGFSRLSSLG